MILKEKMFLNMIVFFRFMAGTVLPAPACRLRPLLYCFLLPLQVQGQRP